MSLNMLDLYPGRDVSDIVEALRRNEAVEVVDLRDNGRLDDAALQVLLLALMSGGVAPKLRTVRLKGTGHTVISQSMAKGLALMRKGLVFEF